MLIPADPTYIEFNLLAGDTETLRLNVVDSESTTLDLLNNTTVFMYIKKDVLDTTPILAPVQGEIFPPGRGYNVEFLLSEDDTLSILNYNSKLRKKVKVMFDVKVLKSNEGTSDTIENGYLNVTKTISGVV